MKSKARSSITLCPSELKMVNDLARRLHAKTKVEVIRRGLKLLKETTDRDEIRKSYATASMAVRMSNTDLDDL